MLYNLKKQGITILVSTPYMDEASLCDRIALIQDGKFLKIDTPKNIISEFKNDLWSVASNNMSKLLSDLRMHEKISTCFAFGDTHHISIDKGEQEKGKGLIPAELTKYLVMKGHKEIDIISIEASIEDCFMELTA